MRDDRLFRRRVFVGNWLHW